MAPVGHRASALLSHPRKSAASWKMAAQPSPLRSFEFKCGLTSVTVRKGLCICRRRTRASTASSALQSEAAMGLPGFTAALVPARALIGKLISRKTIRKLVIDESKRGQRGADKKQEDWMLRHRGGMFAGWRSARRPGAGLAHRPPP